MALLLQFVSTAPSPSAVLSSITTLVSRSTSSSAITCPLVRLRLLMMIALGIPPGSCNPKHSDIIDALKSQELYAAQTMRATFSHNPSRQPIHTSAWYIPKSGRTAPCLKIPLTRWQPFGAIKPIQPLLLPSHPQGPRGTDTSECPCCAFEQGNTDACQACYFLLRLFGQEGRRYTMIKKCGIRQDVRDIRSRLPKRIPAPHSVTISMSRARSTPPLPSVHLGSRPPLQLRPFSPMLP